MHQKIRTRQLAAGIAMKGITLASLLLFLAVTIARSQNYPPSTQPPAGTSPTFLQEPLPAGQMPPDTKAPPPEQPPSDEVQDQIQKKLDSEPALRNDSLKATVDDASVTLYGTIDDNGKRDLAIRIAESYAGERRIVDNIELQARR
jgi:hypothetical protein